MARIGLPFLAGKIQLVLNVANIFYLVEWVKNLAIILAFLIRELEKLNIVCLIKALTHK